MGFRLKRRHIIDFLFPIALFFVFALSALTLILLAAGIPASRIQVTDVCTCCNSGYLFSHRATQGKRGNLAAFLMMRD